jgi:Arc/MetJ-type ribon-helix-helix transcriptional regulator
MYASSSEFYRFAIRDLLKTEKIHLNDQEITEEPTKEVEI